MLHTPAGTVTLQAGIIQGVYGEPIAYT